MGDRRHHAPVQALAWSPDATRIASADRQGSVQFWEAETSIHTLTYSGHRFGVCALVWSSDGTYLASAGEDGTVRTWEARTGVVYVDSRATSGLLAQ